MSLFLAMLLTSCASLPSNSLPLDPCPIPYAGKAEVVTNGVLLRVAVEREFALKQCNVDKATVKAYLDRKDRPWWAVWK